jgi:hypothetical protein
MISAARCSCILGHEAIRGANEERRRSAGVSFLPAVLTACHRAVKRTRVPGILRLCWVTWLQDETKAHPALVVEMKKFLLITLVTCIVFNLVILWILWD